MPYITLGRKGQISTFRSEDVVRIDLTTTLRTSVGERRIPQIKVFLRRQPGYAILVDYDYACDNTVRFLDYDGLYRSQAITKDNCFDVAQADFDIIDRIVKYSWRARLKALAKRAASVFDSYAWARRFIGGHWELWYVDHPVCSDIWHKVETCSKESGRRPTPICRGTPKCEEYE